MRSGRLLRPPPLQRGDVIGIVSPASTPDAGLLQRGIQALEDAGFRTVLASHALDRWGYLAGSDEDRAADVMEMFTREDIRAVWCARGGYGAARILNRLDWSAIGANPKAFVGYSDITTLLLGMLRLAGVVCFHGPMATTLGGGLDRWSADLLWRSLMVEEPVGPLFEDPESIRCLIQGNARGTLSGGCLSILCASLGCPEEPDFAGCVVFLEDTDEPLYRVDRLLAQLVRSGCLDEAAGIVFGNVTNLTTAEKDRPHTLETVLMDHLARLGKPLLCGAPFGHVDNPITVPFGIVGELYGASCQVVAVEPAVATYQ